MIRTLALVALTQAFQAPSRRCPLRARRQAKETTTTTSATIVPPAGPGGGATAEMARTASTLSHATGISKASIAELVNIIPSFTVEDLRTLYKKFFEHVTAADGYLQQQTFSAVRPATATAHASG